MYCPEHLAFKALNGRVYVWMYWRDVRRETIPLRIWLNPLRYQVTLRFFGRCVHINRDGRWARKFANWKHRIKQAAAKDTP